jgi:hypothetical protein
MSSVNNKLDYAKKYREEHKEEIKRKAKEWREHNKTYFNDYYNEHKEQLQAIARYNKKTPREKRPTKSELMAEIEKLRNRDNQIISLLKV